MQAEQNICAIGITVLAAVVVIVLADAVLFQYVHQAAAGAFVTPATNDLYGGAAVGSADRPAGRADAGNLSAVL